MKTILRPPKRLRLRAMRLRAKNKNNQNGRWRAATLFCICLLSNSASADLLEEIRRRGTLRAGVSADYKPYSFREQDGQRVGLEPDLAAETAKLIGVKLELVPLESIDRVTAISEQQVDLVIASVADRPGLTQVADMVEPGYYASGINILTRKVNGFTSWEELVGANVCTLEGAAFNQRASQDYGAELLTFKTIDDSLAALKDSQCLGLIYNDAYFTYLQATDISWNAFHMPLASQDEQRWVILIRKEEALFKTLLSGLVLSWHKQGKLLEMQQKWDILPTPYIETLHEIYK